jgi:hypothetical protein
MNFTPAEEKALSDIAKKIAELRMFLGKYELPADTSRLEGWYHFLNVTRSILGNFNNDVSTIATLLAKRYLMNRFPGLEFDACAKRQGASGLDVNVVSENGQRIIAEIKTVDPYNPTDFGAAQRDAFLKDFAKLANTVADHKYLFLTEPRAFEVIQNKYLQRLASVTVVCLADGKELAA